MLLKSDGVKFIKLKDFLNNFLRNSFINGLKIS